jgi:hypothetical protein
MLGGRGGLNVIVPVILTLIAKYAHLDFCSLAGGLETHLSVFSHDDAIPVVAINFFRRMMLGRCKRTFVFVLVGGFKPSQRSYQRSVGMQRAGKWNYYILKLILTHFKAKG